MTEEQIKTWRKHRDIAKKIEDPIQRQLALDKLYEEKDDLMQECFFKQSNRIKNVVREVANISTCTNEIKNQLSAISCRLTNNDDVTYRLNEQAQQFKGMQKIIKLLWIIATSGGAGVLIWLIKTVSQ